jgi:uncharacterized protein YlxP (DUF503 family)
MFVGYARFDLRLPASSSLKDKRSVIRGLTTRLHQRFGCAVGEVEHQDLRQRAGLAVAVVAGTSYHAKRVLHEVGRHVETHPGVELLDIFTDVFAPEEDR